MAFSSKKYIVKAGKKVNLDDWNPNDKKDVPNSKEKRVQYLDSLIPQLESLQERFYAEGKHKFLLILQGMDAAGKDGSVRKIFQMINPAGVRITSFKVPSAEEKAHDFLWRIHLHVPRAGEIAVFNRSHYEDVLVQKVRGWIDEKEELRRFEHIKNFEKLLVETGTTVVKCFLHISKDEQKERLQARIDTPDKHWKCDPSDINDRKLWQTYQDQYARVIAHTSTDYAPWHIIPANSKSARNCILMNIILEKLNVLNPKYPDVDMSQFPKKVK